MFGANPIRPAELSDGSILKVQKIFPTIQGEGPYSGWPSVFIRLGGCNLACEFCDTEFEGFTESPLTSILEQVATYTKGTKIKLIVITGGEPFRQSIGLLCEQLIEKNYIVQIESNGTIYQKIPSSVEVVCSPKLSKNKYHQIREDLKKHVIAYKFLISKTFAEYKHIPEWDFGNAKIYIQPIDEYDDVKNAENTKYSMELAFKTGYIFSPQLHKILGIE